MSNRTVVTVSSAKGINQYMIPLHFKKILFLISLFIVALCLIVAYYIQEIHLKLEDSYKNIETLTSKIEENKAVVIALKASEEVLSRKEIALSSLFEEKIIMEETLSDNIERLIIAKNKLQIEQQFTVEVKNARENSLVQLTNMLSEIEIALKKESRLNDKLEHKLSSRIKKEKDRIQKEKEKIKRDNEARIILAAKKSNRDNKLKRIAKSHLGKRYVWGSIGPRTFDCSGFTLKVFKTMGVTIPRVSRKQAKHGKLVARDKLKVGDLIFFDTATPRKGYVNHVGIYLGNNQFIHASSSKRKVVITKLTKTFYKNRYKWARRVL
jgi:cell wall-associated NlpC family hydrolase